MSKLIANDHVKQKVLVYLFGSLGDSIVAIPALRAIRRRFPKAEIVMLENLDKTLVRASQVIPDSLIDRYLSYNSRPNRFTKPAEFYRLWRKLRRERFTAAAYLIMSERPERAVMRDRLFFRSVGIRDLYGFHPIASAELYPIESSGRPAVSKHEAIYKLERLARDGIEFVPKSDLEMPLIEPSAAELAEIDEWLKTRRNDGNAPLVSIGPGCKQEVNEWPLENFIALGGRLTQETPCELIVVGGKAEFEIGEKLVAAWGGGINAEGAFSVRQSAALLKRCDFHLGLDTGTTHLAAAVGTRCFAIFGGRNNPGMWYPIGGGHTVVNHRVACAPCRSLTCSVNRHPCMTEISPDAIWEHLISFMRSDPKAGSEVNVITV
jgi:heptosyltransferase III